MRYERNASIRPRAPPRRVAKLCANAIAARRRTILHTVSAAGRSSHARDLSRKNTIDNKKSSVISSGDSTVRTNPRMSETEVEGHVSVLRCYLTSVSIVDRGGVGEISGKLRRTMLACEELTLDHHSY